jgi:ferritin
MLTGGIVMFKQSVQNAVNEQINKELYSAYVYLGMSSYCESINLTGFSHWMRMQSREELGHAMRLFDFVNDRGGKVELLAIDKPPTNYRSPLDVMEQTLKHEQYVTALIEKLYEVAVKEHDYATQAQLQWFITEQVEEEKNASSILEALKMVGDNRTALIMLDMEMAKRTGEEE